MVWWQWCALLAIAGAVYAYFAGAKKPKTFRGKDGVVYLNVFGRTEFGPSASSFCIKLETWLRMSGVPFEVMKEWEFSSKGKSPWLHYNGVVVADSTLAIDHLKAQPELKVDLDAHLTPAQAAVAHAFKVMCDENLYWGLVYTRWITNPSISHYIGQVIPVIPAALRGLVIPLLRSGVNKQLNGHGIGRHSAEDVWRITQRDAQAIADHMAGHGGRFLMGDKPCSADAAVFGLMAGLLWAPYHSPLTKYVAAQPVLVAYAERFRDTYWPDWADFCKPNGKKAFP